MSQKNCPGLYNILNEWGKILTRNRRHLFLTVIPTTVVTVIPTTQNFNIKHGYNNAIPVSSTSTYPSLMIDNEHEKPALEDVYRTKSGRIAKKPKQYIDEMWYYLFSTFGLTINKPKHNEIWDDLFDKATYWRSVIYMIVITFMFWRKWTLRLIASLKTTTTKKQFFIYLRRGMLYIICCITFISFISFTKVHRIHFMYQSPTHSFCHSFILQIIVYPIRIHHIWFCSYCILFQPHVVFHFFNQSRFWELRMYLDKISIWTICYIIWI